MAEKIEKSGEDLKGKWKPSTFESRTEAQARELLEASGLKVPSLAEDVKRGVAKVVRGKLPSALEAAAVREFEKYRTNPGTDETAGVKKEKLNPGKAGEFKSLKEIKELAKQGKGQAMPDLSSPEDWEEFGKQLAVPTEAPPEIKSAPLASPEKPKEFTKITPATEAKTGSVGKGPAEEPRQKELDETELARRGAEITLYKINNYQELWAKTEQEGDEKFLQKTRELWKEFAVHGLVGYDKEGKVTITNETDEDGQGCLFLMKLAGFNTDDLKYVKQGDYAEDRIYFDVGGVHGIVLMDGGKKVFIDHHTNESGKESSATKFTYELLKATGLLKGEKDLDNLVNFITQIDNKTYFSDERSFRNSWRTVFGLHHYIDFPKIVELFQAGVKPGEILSEENLKKFGLEDASKRQAITIRESVKHMQRIEKGGLVVPSERFGKIAVDIEKRVGAGFDAARAFGYPTYLIWSPKTESFFITSKERLNKEKIGQGWPVRGHMWIKPRGDGQRLKVKLPDVLNSLTDGKFEPTLKLKEFIEKEQKEMEIKQLLEPKKLEILEKFGKEFYNTLKKDAAWEGYDQKREEATLKIQTEVFLAVTLKEIVKEEDKAEKIIEYLIARIKQ